MATAKRRTLHESTHFSLSTDKIGKIVVRYVLRCKKCNKERVMAGGVRSIKHKCCSREFEFDTTAPAKVEEKKPAAKAAPAKTEEKKTAAKAASAKKAVAKKKTTAKKAVPAKVKKK